jgi:small subunit ribosomal protein S16
MAVALRLSRQGAKDRPYYKIVAVDQRKRRDGRYIEQIGTYDPMVKGDNSTIDLAKAEKWLSVGARPSDTVRSIIRKARTKASEETPVQETPAKEVEAPAKEEAPAAAEEEAKSADSAE